MRVHEDKKLYNSDPRAVTGAGRVVSVDKRIGALKDKCVFAPGYDFDEDNEKIAKLFGEI